MTNKELEKLVKQLDDKVGGLIVKLEDASGVFKLRTTGKFSEASKIRTYPITCLSSRMLGVRGDSAVVPLDIDKDLLQGKLGVLVSNSHLSVTHGVSIPTTIVQYKEDEDVVVRLINNGEASYDCKKGSVVAELLVFDV